MAFCSDVAWENWAYLLDSVTTGKPVFELLGKKPPFAAMEDRPEFSAIFNQAMSEVTRQSAGAIAAGYEFSRLGTLADVGGGDGTLLAVILAATPGLRGMLVDLPTGLGKAPERLGAAGVLERCEIVPGDMFRSVPRGADAYLMKSVIHDWTDEQAVAILGNVRQALKPGGRVLVVEPVLPDTLGSVSAETHGAILAGDLDMLLSTGGRERTEAEFRSLLRAAGLDLARVIALEAPQLSMLEAVAAA
jgi:SAM-dependent methyltransferase